MQHAKKYRCEKRNLKENEVYLLYHPSYENQNGGLYSIVNPVFDINENLVGWRSVETGCREHLALKGYTREWQDRIMPLPPLDSKDWFKPNEKQR
jgi:hypothetical protein